ncbi:hypothetical protein CARUB_v10016150mg [Capsella rubella]|uniref:Uncharacterized protein n=1 Tax=Capsella rubella TaxID=81985 RepID=R0GAV5_9BRAS|nr:hypothetical protein CARUB_v10016150mg [Capsella rubella]
MQHSNSCCQLVRYALLQSLSYQKISQQYFPFKCSMSSGGTEPESPMLRIDALGAEKSPEQSLTPVCSFKPEPMISLFASLICSSAESVGDA